MIHKTNHKCYLNAFKGGCQWLFWCKNIFNGSMDPVQFERNMYSKNYREVMLQRVLNITGGRLQKYSNLQQYDAPVHASTQTREPLHASDVDVLNWLTTAPDLKICKNVWWFFNGKYSVLGVSLIQFIRYRTLSCATAMGSLKTTLTVCTVQYRLG